MIQIKVTANGPYIVTGGAPLDVQQIVLDADGQCLAWRQSWKYPRQEVYSLCRCGRSRNRPFCDGTHRDINFAGTETADTSPYLESCQRFPGPSLLLTDVRKLCAHAGFCDRAGGTWRLVRQSDDPESRRIAIEESQNCPSGRLVIWRDGEPVEPALEPSIGLVASPDGALMGPIWVRGGIPVISADGRIYEVRNRVTLCGCGRSANKPFCDGAHRQPGTALKPHHQE
ncbi:MAG: CDGSH iron-sulfur domain-containing protein [Chloroflexi bacterium]|nr:CDGSH iron-sulfur domain-containing protein [Chloroflexota bacterium]